jgi:tetratricopeptide (TPR) repeat protein
VATPKDKDILRKAARCHTVSDREFSLQCLEAGRAAFPADFEWYLGLAHFYWLDINGEEGSKQRLDSARKALEAQERALELLVKESGFVNSPQELDSLADLALYAYESNDIARATELCKQVVATTQSDRESFADEYHSAHQVLGRIALRRGDLKDAGAHLVESANVPGSPVLRSFGPRFRLAKLLAAAGEKERVLRYFEACRKFWDRPELAQWTSDLKEGRQPSISQYAE